MYHPLRAKGITPRQPAPPDVIIVALKGATIQEGIGYFTVSALKNVMKNVMKIVMKIVVKIVVPGNGGSFVESVMSPINLVIADHFA